MAIVISAKIKAVLGAVFGMILLTLGLIVGSAVGWFEDQGDRPLHAPGDLPYMPYRDSAIRNRIHNNDKQVSVRFMTTPSKHFLREVVLFR